MMEIMMEQEEQEFKTFEELKEGRRIGVEGMKKGGLLNLLDMFSDYYPDSAHFIYELLQNAEDMEAAEVNFTLCQDKLVFEHNGRKRDFNLKDIDAITNKRKSPKADDPNQIGKFGMGFKSVYVYTYTPEIHSGEFNFKIENVVIPNDEGVSKTSKNGITQFIFPFDNPEKPAETAVQEIQEAFEKLNENSILFLTNIKAINYTLPDGRGGSISVTDEASSINFISSIIIKHPDNTEKITYWAKFSDECFIKVNR